ncbi:MAG: hypothetical protein KatS3mg097_604 [Candidatus Parcubacteria bacterium]|nr:MAG: hypothetical protein KatS3mg097_604 [Candidatus Parcubacteria bacterium]
MPLDKIKNIDNKDFLELFSINYYPTGIGIIVTDYQIKSETREEAAEKISLQETDYKVKARYQIPNTLVHHHSLKGNSFFKITVLRDLVGKEKNFRKPDCIKNINSSLKKNCGKILYQKLRTNAQSH